MMMVKAGGRCTGSCTETEKQEDLRILRYLDRGLVPTFALAERVTVRWWCFVPIKVPRLSCCTAHYSTSYHSTIHLL